MREKQNSSREQGMEKYSDLGYDRLRMLKYANEHWDDESITYWKDIIEGSAQHEQVITTF